MAPLFHSVLTSDCPGDGRQPLGTAEEPGWGRGPPQPWLSGLSGDSDKGRAYSERGSRLWACAHPEARASHAPECPSASGSTGPARLPRSPGRPVRRRPRIHQQRSSDDLTCSLLRASVWVAAGPVPTRGPGCLSGHGHGTHRRPQLGEDGPPVLCYLTRDQGLWGRGSHGWSPQGTWTGS